MAVDSRWYVVHTYSGYENKVKTNIEKVVENRNMHNEIFEVKIPTETVTEIVGDKKREVERKLFPGYVLVKVAVHLDDDDRPAMNDETWLVIRNTRGVTGFVGPENKAIPLTEEEVYKLGVEKRSGFTGTVEEIDVENNLVRVSVSALFGKETKVELELDQVEPIED